MKGLEGDGRQPIKSRKCRRHYGTDCSTTFVAGRHEEVDSYICRFTGRKKACDQMSWLVKKGQDLSTSEASHVSHAFNSSRWLDAKKTTSVDLLASDEDEASGRCTDPVSLHFARKLATF